MFKQIVHQIITNQLTHSEHRAFRVPEALGQSYRGIQKLGIISSFIWMLIQSMEHLKVKDVNLSNIRDILV